MSKIKINMIINSPDEDIKKEISGIFEGNRIVYIDDKIKTTLIIDKALYMCRESNEYKFEFIFDRTSETKGRYTLKLYNAEMEIKINTKELIIQDNYIKLKYHLTLEDEDMGNFSLELKYEII